MHSRAEYGLKYLSTLSVWSGEGRFNLEKIKRVLFLLGDPHNSIPIVHIAGTNGKGSVSAAIASILGASGYRVGLNISPHLANINERVVLNGVSCEDEWLGEFAYGVRQAATRSGESLSFHEAITCCAFLGFRESNIEWGVFEVGVGGRVDASNVIDRPAITCITSIDYDHQDILGPTIEEIAAHKVGICKVGVPLVVGPLAAKSFKVVKAVCKEKNAALISYGNDFVIKQSPSQHSDLTEFTYRASGLTPNHESFSTSLLGDHQSFNMSLAITMGLKLGLSLESCREGISQVFWPGRLEKINLEGKRLTFDCAHNPASIKTFISFLDKREKRDIDLSFGVLETKQWREMLVLLAPYVRTWRLVDPVSSRALTSRAVGLALSGYEVNKKVYGSDLERYLSELLQEQEVNEHYICGSIYLVGKIRAMLGISAKPLWSKKVRDDEHKR